MRRWPFLLIVAAAIGAGACGSSTTPSTTTTTVAATLAITPTTGAIAVGQVAAYSVINSAAGDTIAWSSSDASIFSVDSNGNVAGISRGTATLTATASSGPTATLQIQVAPNYQGTWSGNAAVTACTDIGGYNTAGYCAQRVNTVQRITVSFSQNGLGVAGTLTQAEPTGQVTGPVTGAIGTGGDISSLVGTLTGVINGSNTSTALIAWNSLASDAGLTGNFAANVTSPQVVGIATVQWHFNSVPKVAGNKVPSGGLWALLDALPTSMSATPSSGFHRLLTPRVRWALVLVVLALTSGCSDTTTPTTPSTTGIPSEITLTKTIVNLVAPPTAAVIATVRDENSAPVSGLTVTFTTTSGFITSGAVTGIDGVAIGILTGTIGASPTVTASVTVDTTTVKASTVVEF